MEPLAELISQAAADYPHLALVLSGPWKDRDGHPVEKPWICNFKNQEWMNDYVHPGSSGDSPEEAVAAGLAFLRSNPDNPRLACSERPEEVRASVI